MQRILLALLFATLAAVGVQAQPVGLIVGDTPVIGGSSNDCLTILNSVLSSAACGGGGGGGNVSTGVTLTTDNIVTGAGTTNVKDSGFQIISSFGAGQTWTNPTNAAGAPVASNILSMPDGACPVSGAQTSTYGFFNSPLSGIYSATTNSIDFCLNGSRTLQIATSNTGIWTEILNAAIRSQGSANQGMALAANGTGAVTVANNGNAANHIIANFFGDQVSAGTTVNSFRFDASATGNPLKITGVGGDSNLNLNVILPGSGVFQFNGNAVLYNSGPLGTPASATLTSAIGLPISTGLTGAGTGVLTALGNNTNGTGGFPTFSGTLGAPTATSILHTPTAYASLAAAGHEGTLAFVNNIGAVGSWLWDSGSRWKGVGKQLVAALDTASSLIANSATIVFQKQFPANTIQVGDRLEFRVTELKSGTTDTCAMVTKVGTAGTTGDTSIFSNTLIIAANKVTSVIQDYRLETATTLRQMGPNANTSTTSGYSSTSSATPNGAVTISDASANALWFSVSILSSSTNDTCQVIDAQLYLTSTPN